MAKTIRFTLNGEPASVTTDADRMLLWVLRTDLGLTGTKFGCGEGLLRLVHRAGRRPRRCARASAVGEGRRQAEVLTIEGLAEATALHPLQQAFVEHDALQCGYCTPGHDPERRRAAGDATPEPAREEIATRHGREPVPLRRARAHRRRDRDRGRGDGKEAES